MNGSPEKLISPPSLAKMGQLFLYVSPGETMTEAFPSWLRLCYDGETYKPFDLNMPPVMVKRRPSLMKHDSPLTEHGDVVAQLTGRAVGTAGIQPIEIISGPELSSVQTAIAISKTLGSPCPISIEGALSAWRGLVPSSQTYLNAKELAALGFPVDLSYHQTIKTCEIPSDETVLAYQERMSMFHKKCISEMNGDKIFITDAAGVLTMRGAKWTTPQEMLKMRASLRPCTVQLIRIDKNKKEKLDNTSMLPVTTSYVHARELEKQKA